MISPRWRSTLASWLTTFLVLYRCYNPDGGGFGGGPGQDPHVCSTYAAVASLVILGEMPGWLDTNKQLSFLLSLKNDHDGSFRTTPDKSSETDARGCYCALAVAHLLGLPLEGDVVKGCQSYLQRLQTYEGGFAAEEGGEAHCGFTYCAVAALRLLGSWPRAVTRCVRWATRRQRDYEGGFNGRANKLVVRTYNKPGPSLLMSCSSTNPKAVSGDRTSFPLSAGCMLLLLVWCPLPYPGLPHELQFHIPTMLYTGYIPTDSIRRERRLCRQAWN